MIDPIYFRHSRICSLKKKKFLGTSDSLIACYWADGMEDIYSIPMVLIQLTVEGQPCEPDASEVYRCVWCLSRCNLTEYPCKRSLWWSLESMGQSVEKPARQVHSFRWDHWAGLPGYFINTTGRSLRKCVNYWHV